MMNLWMSGEIMADVANLYRVTRKEIEEYINKFLAEKNYGDGLNKLTYIAIMRPKGDENYPEINKFHKRDKDAEFRLKIDYEKFKESTETEQKKLVCESLLRSIKKLPDIGVKDFDYDKFELDFLNLVKEKGWL